MDSDLNLIAVDTVARGNVSSCRVSIPLVICRGRFLGAAGFILVHNHPSGDSRPSSDDIDFTKRLSRIAAEMELPLLDHFIVAGSELRGVGEW